MTSISGKQELLMFECLNKQIIMCLIIISCSGPKNFINVTFPKVRQLKKGNTASTLYKYLVILMYSALAKAGEGRMKAQLCLRRFPPYLQDATVNLPPQESGGPNWQVIRLIGKRSQPPSNKNYCTTVEVPPGLGICSFDIRANRSFFVKK